MSLLSRGRQFLLTVTGTTATRWARAVPDPLVPPTLPTDTIKTLPGIVLYDFIWFLYDFVWFSYNFIWFYMILYGFYMISGGVAEIFG